MHGGSNKGDETPANLIDFMARFASSAQFREVFEEGMRLVEETADYLDGPGRAAARGMSRQAAIAYATESMRLTTRLMQMASWLLLQRAVSANELSEAEAEQEQARINLASVAHEPAEENLQHLPPELLELMERGQQLYERILQLDSMISRRETPDAQDAPSAVAGYLDRIASEFGQKKQK